MPKFGRLLPLGVVAGFWIWAGAAARAQVPLSAFVNFEGSQTNPIRISPDGTRLYAVNTPDARLSVFDISQPSLSPVLLAEIPVGIEPVSLNPRTNDEVWVVNQESDSVSVVSVSKGIVTDTIYVKDEPADVVFAGRNLAFVSVARSNLINVYSTATHQLVKSIPVLGENPRAMAVSPDGSKVYSAFALSGNHTTLIPAGLAPAQPAPTNTSLPAPPLVGLITDASDPHWQSFIKFTMPDNDVVAVDTASLAVAGYFSHVGTINLGLAVQPTTGDLWVSNTDSQNLTRFEPNLKGRFVANRVTRINTALGQVTPIDLNPPPVGLSTALAQPAAAVFGAGGRYLYVASFGTDRIAVIDTTTQSVIARIEIGQTPGTTVNPRLKRGPRGLAINSTAQRLYVLNRLWNTITVVNTSGNTVVTEIPVGKFDPTPTIIHSGRGFLYDAKLSGNGSGSCSSCHVDADMDLLAWDLGDPGGSMTAVTENGTVFSFHPMKGPMTTQTLRGLNSLSPFHWRGDHVNFAAFNPAFASLLGGTQLSTADINAYTAFINTIAFQPNPNQNLDRSYPTSLTLPFGVGVGDANAGKNTFVNTPFTTTVTCNSCHTANPGGGTNRQIVILGDMSSGATQPFKNPHLRNMYQKMSFNQSPGAQSVGGFGFRNDGNQGSLFGLLASPTFGTFANNPTIKMNLEAFLLCFDTGMAPAVGYSRTVTAANLARQVVQNDWAILQSRAITGDIDLIAKGTLNGQVHGLLYLPASNSYQVDKTGLGPYTPTQLSTLIAQGDTLTLMGVPPGSGVRMGIDRNLDGVLDGDGQ